MDIDTIRAGIPALSETTFFNTAGIGPMPSVVADEVVNLLRYEEAQGRSRPDVMQAMSGKAEDARRAVAGFFGVTPEEVTFTHSISEGMSLVADGLDWRAGDEVIITDQEHTSGYLPWALQAERYGVVVKRLRLMPDPEGIVSRLKALLTDRTRVVALSHVTSSLGIRLPAADIVRVAREAGALVGFDGAQAAGQFPIDLRETGCDFYAATSYKWCLGPYGIGALFVRREALPRLAVRRSGAHAPAKVDPAAGTFAFPDAARKFEFGARNLPLRIGYGRALRYLSGIGLAGIETHVRGAVRYFKERVAEIPGARVQTPASFCAGAINVAFDGADPRALQQRLWEAHRTVVVNPAGGLRFSIAFFTTQEDMDRVVDAIKDIRKNT